MLITCFHCDELEPIYGSLPMPESFQSLTYCSSLTYHCSFPIRFVTIHCFCQIHFSPIHALFQSLNGYSSLTCHRFFQIHSWRIHYFCRRISGYCGGIHSLCWICCPFFQSWKMKGFLIIQISFTISILDHYLCRGF